MKISIIGAGNVGSVLAEKLQRAGHDVAIANSRGPHSLKFVAEQTGATPLFAKDAVDRAEVIIISVPQIAVPQLSPLFSDVRDSAVIIDTCNYFPELRDGQIRGIEDGMTDSEWVQETIGLSVVKAFNNITSKSLRELGKPEGDEGRVALPVAGDVVAHKRLTMVLVNQLGFDTVDAGSTKDSWRQQPGTPAYIRDLKRADLLLALAAADPDKIAEYRLASDEVKKRWAAYQREREARISKNEL